jgi:predicted Zn finger-like uncharacterized protein
MKTRCPHCDIQFKTADENVGKKAKCPKCKQIFTISSFNKTRAIDPIASSGVNRPKGYFCPDKNQANREVIRKEKNLDGEPHTADRKTKRLPSSQTKKIGIPITVAIIVVGIVIGYYGGVFRPDESIISNSERLLQEGESLLTKSGNIAVARKNLAWVEEGLPTLNIWYAFPTHKVRGRNLAVAMESFKKRIDERESLQRTNTLMVDELLASQKFKKAGQELQNAVRKTGAEDAVMRALLSRIQDAYSVHVEKEVRSKVGAEDYQGQRIHLMLQPRLHLG